MVHLPVDFLRIGTWTRFAQTPASSTTWDLQCTADAVERHLTWLVQADPLHQYRIQVPVESILQLRFQSDHLEVHLQADSCLSFAMLDHGNWVRCGDFTEDRQASFEPVHILQGQLLRNALVQLTLLLPELATKTIFIQDPPFLTRNMTLSPSMTPEPYNMDQLVALQPQPPQQLQAALVPEQQQLKWSDPAGLYYPFVQPTVADPVAAWQQQPMMYMEAYGFM